MILSNNGRHQIQREGADLLKCEPSIRQAHDLEGSWWYREGWTIPFVSRGIGTGDTSAVVHNLFKTLHFSNWCNKKFTKKHGTESSTWWLLHVHAVNENWTSISNTFCKFNHNAYDMVKRYTLNNFPTLSLKQRPTGHHPPS